MKMWMKMRGKRVLKESNIYGAGGDKGGHGLPNSLVVRRLAGGSAGPELVGRDFLWRESSHRAGRAPGRSPCFWVIGGSAGAQTWRGGADPLQGLC